MTSPSPVQPDGASSGHDETRPPAKPAGAIVVDDGGRPVVDAGGRPIPVEGPSADQLEAEADQAGDVEPVEPAPSLEAVEDVEL